MNRPSDSFNVGDVCLTTIDRAPVEVVIVAIREPNSLANWTSADQSKRVYKVKRNQGMTRISGKYFVRQSHQLRLSVPAAVEQEVLPTQIIDLFEALKAALTTKP